MTELTDLYSAVVDMQEDTAMSLTNKYLDEGTKAIEIFNCYQEAMAEIGKRFEKQIYFIPELIMSGEMMKASARVLKPYLADQNSKEDEKEQNKLGKVLIATVEGDIHDIGKNIATMMMDINGFDVRDIGVDVPIDKIIDEAKDFGADVIGLSGLLTLAFDPMKLLVDRLKEQGLRNEIKVIIGGGQMDEQICGYVGADAFVTDAVEGINYIKGWLR